MSYEHGTPFLNLPQTVGSDHRDWFDTNEAFLDLDTKMKTLWDGSSSIETILTALQESVATLSTDVTTLSGIVSGHTSTITTINESLVLINTALNALNTQVVGKFDSVGIADAYDATHGVYSVGDIVTYNGQRYVCTTAVTAAEPFDVSKWNAEDVQTAIDTIQSEIDNISTPHVRFVTVSGQSLTIDYDTLPDVIDINWAVLDGSNVHGIFGTLIIENGALTTANLVGVPSTGYATTATISGNSVTIPLGTAGFSGRKFPIIEYYL